MKPKMLEASRVYEQELDKNRLDEALPNRMMITYELFEQEVSKYDKALEALKAMYEALPILRAQAEEKSSIPVNVHNEVQATVRTLCNKLTDSNMRCYYDDNNPHIYRNTTDNAIDDLDVEFNVDGRRYLIQMSDYIDMEQCRQWLSQREEFGVNLVSMGGVEQNDTLADLLYTSYFNNEKLITRDESGFSVDMDAVNDRLMEMKYRPFAVPKVEYKAITAEELMEMRNNELENEEKKFTPVKITNHADLGDNIVICGMKAIELRDYVPLVSKSESLARELNEFVFSHGKTLYGKDSAIENILPMPALVLKGSDEELPIGKNITFFETEEDYYVIGKNNVSGEVYAVSFDLMKHIEDAIDYIQNWVEEHRENSNGHRPSQSSLIDIAFHCWKESKEFKEETSIGYDEDVDMLVHHHNKIGECASEIVEAYLKFDYLKGGYDNPYDKALWDKVFDLPNYVWDKEIAERLNNYLEKVFDLMKYENFRVEEVAEQEKDTIANDEAEQDERDDI